MMRIAALIVASSVSVFAGLNASDRASVDLEVTLPTGATPRVIVREREGAAIRLPDGTRYGFVPTIEADERRVKVTVWALDSKPSRMLGSVEVEVGGPVVRSETTPSFGLRIMRIIRTK